MSAFNKAGRTLLFLLITLLCSAAVTAQPACKGPNKNDPGCPGAEDPPVEEPPVEEPPVEALPEDAVKNASVDWLNEAVVIRGTGLSAASEFRIGGSAPLTPSSASDTEVVIDFDASLEAEVNQAGNYVLFADGAAVLNLYFESSVVDASDGTCPCEPDWLATPGTRWGASDTTCIDIPGPGDKDFADIAGTVLDASLDTSVYPQYAIGAAFLPGEPSDSLCRLVQINGDGSQVELVNFRINESQQADCAIELRTNVCAP